VRRNCAAKRAETGSVETVWGEVDGGEVGAKVAAKPIIRKRFI
jgi:hypothetical protein